MTTVADVLLFFGVIAGGLVGYFIGLRNGREENLLAAKIAWDGALEAAAVCVEETRDQTVEGVYNPALTARQIRSLKDA